MIPLNLNRLTASPVNSAKSPRFLRRSVSGNLNRNLRRDHITEQSGWSHRPPPQSPRPRTPRLGFDISTLPCLTSTFESAFFNRKVLDYLKKALNVYSVSDFSPAQMEEEIKILCKRHLRESMRRAPLPSSRATLRSGDFLNEESPRAKDIWKLLQNSTVLLGPTLERLTALENALKTYLEGRREKTVWCDEMAFLLKALIEASDLHAFLRLLSDERYPEDIRKICMRTLGSLKKDRVATLTFLKKWADVSSYRLLKEEVRDSNCDTAIACIPSCEHEWLVSADVKRKLREIPTKEIVRSLFMTCPIYSLITVNGKRAADGSFESLANMRRVFFKRLMNDICAGLKVTPNSHQIDEWVSSLLLSIDVSQETNPTVACDLIPLLLLLTNSCWGHADVFIRKRFPGLFRRPYWSRPVDGIIAHIVCDSPTNYSVTQVKQYGVYYRLNRTDPDCYMIDTEHRLALLRFAWKITVNDDRITGSLQIPEFILDETTSVMERWDILRSVIDYEDHEDLSASAGSDLTRPTS